MRTPRKQKGNQKPEIRSLKIQPRYRFNNHETRIVPELVLCGNWLKESGFEPESRVTAEASKRRIVIRPEPEEK